MSPVPGSGEEVEATIHQENEKDVDEAVLPNEEAHMRKLGSMASPMKRKLSSGLREAWSAVTDSAEIQPEIKRPRVLAPDRRTPPNSVTRHEASFGQLPSPQGSAPQTSDQVPSSINGNNLVTREWSKLPRDVWRRIYTLLSPVELINLLGVNRSFYNDLAPSTFGISGPSNRAPKFSHQGREADEIWVSSRKRFFPGTPNRPLRGRSELDMWRIINSRFCQSCGKEGHREMIASMGFPWEPNLGEDGVTIIWPFGVRRCGSCLLEETEKELTLLISSSVPSTLLAALPFIFVTPSLHVITPTMLQKATPRPTLQMTKVFFKADIQVIMHQFDDVRAESPAATEAWINGLEKQAKENSDNAGQWERWFTTGVVNRSITLPGRTASDATSALVSASQVAADHSGPGSASNNSSPASYITSSFGGVKVESPSQSYSPRDLVHGLPRHVASGAPPRSSMSPGQSAFFHPPNQSFQRGRTERSNREINEFKAARRAEIERRCSELDPPIQPTLLSHMESFQAAMKILTPLTDSAWDVLRPRLIAQREAAEYAENERMAQSRAFQAKFEERRQQEASLKEHKDMLDKEWDEMQSPIRELLAKYADEIIDGSWKSGEAITNDTSPKFAADVLIHVRKRFYHDVAEEDAADSTAGREVKRDTQGSPPTRRLILENMKWVFDTKIKPLTEPFRKELFLCNGCENNFKFYGFEGVIQHFAAKHTSELSMGSVIVHWRAEWPEDPPFHPNPSAAKAAFYAVPPPAGMPGHPGSGVSQTSFPYSGYSQGSGPMAHLPPRGAPGYPQYSPVPFGHQQYGEHYPNNVHGPFPPPQAYSGPSHGFHQGNTGYSSTHPGYSGHPSGFPGQYPPYPAPHSGYNGPSPNFQGYSSYQGQPPQSFSSPMQSHVYPSVVQGPVQSGPGGYGQTPASLGQHGPIGPPYGQGLAYQGPASGHNKAPPANMYKLQLDEIATLARDVWLNTSGIKDLPGSVRTTVIIQHVVSRFVAKFPNEPALSLFADGLADHAAMKPIRSINGLTCKACGISQQPRHHSIEKRFYSLSGILLHFQKEHIEQTITIHPNHPLSPRLDWKVDMVELPPEHVIGDLLRAPGMDDTKLQVIAEVFPNVFPRTLPVLGPSNTTGPVPVMHDALESRHPALPRTRGPSSKRYRISPSGFPRDGSDYAHEHRPSASSTARSTPHRGLSYERTSEGNSRELGTSRDVSLGTAPNDSNSTQRARSYQRRDDIITKIHPRYDDHGGRSIRHKAEEAHDYWGRRRTSAMHDRPFPNDRAADDHPTNLRDQNTILARSPLGHRVRPEVDGAFSPDVRSDHVLSRPRSPERTVVMSHVPKRPYPSSNTKPTSPTASKEGSEDGELAAESDDVYDTRATSPAEISAAERFLNDFQPGEDLEEYKHKSSHRDRQEDKVKARWPTEQTTDDLARHATDEGVDVRSGRSDAGRSKADEGSLPEPSPRATTMTSRIEERRRRPPPDAARQPSEGSQDYYECRPAASSEIAPPSPTPESRYIPKTVMHYDERHRSEVMRRPRSRYGRYESFRQESVPGRSRSPKALLKPEGDETRYSRQDSTPRRQAIQQTYHARSPVQVVRDYSPSQSRRVIANAGSPGHYYTYAEDARAYGSYDTPREYLPMMRVSSRSSPPQSTYIVGASSQHPEYERYEPEYRGGPIYDEHGHLVRLERAVYADDPRDHPSHTYRY